MSIPIIDISPHLPSTPNTSSSQSSTPLQLPDSPVLPALRSALLDHGFFYVTGYSAAHAASVAAVLADARHFFLNASPEEKALLKRQGVGVGIGDGARGYQVVGENVTESRRDWHEGFDWYREIEEGEGVGAGDLQWEGEVVVRKDRRGVDGERGGRERGGREGDDGERGKGVNGAHAANGTNGTNDIQVAHGTNGTNGTRVARGTDGADGTHVANGAPLSTKPLPSSRANASTTTSSFSSSKPHRPPPYALLTGPNLWPSTPSTFRTTFTAHVSHMRTLGTIILHLMGQSLNLRDPAIFATAAQDSFWVMRAIGYPPLDPALAAEGGVSCGAHSDYGCLTLLAADETPGALQVWSRTEEKWLSVEPVPGALVVNVGDMVEKWTAGWVRSTRHRVVHTGRGYRVSVPFFLEPGRDVVVGELEECRRAVGERDGVGRRDGEVKGNGEENGEDEGIRFWDFLRGKIAGNFYEGD